MRKEKKLREGNFFLAMQHVAQSSFTIFLNLNLKSLLLKRQIDNPSPGAFVEKGMPLHVSLKRCNKGRRGGTKVKPDHCRYLAMIELHKTDNLIRLSLYELIWVLLR